MIIEIIIIIVAILAFVLLLKLLKSIFKAVLYFAVLAVIALFIVGLLVATDANDFKNNIGTKSNVFLLVNDEQLLAGAQVDRSIEKQVLFTNDTISQYQSFLDENDYKKILQDNYKLFIFNISTLHDIKQNLVYEDFELDPEQGIIILQTPTPFDYTVDYFAKKEGQNNDYFKSEFRKKLEEKFKTRQQYKNAVFLLYISEFFPSKTLNIIDHIKKGDIIVYPKTAMFWAINVLPQGMVNNALSFQKNES